MSGTSDHHSAAADPQHVAAPVSRDAARAALRHGPIGALLISSVTTAMLLVAWLAFYFLLFIPRGSIR